MIVVGALLVVILWGLTITTGIRLIFPRRSVGRRSPATFLASLSAALTFTFNFSPVYIGVDSILGGRNIAALLQHSCLILASFWVMQLLLRSVGKLKSMVNKVLAGSVVFALAVQTVAFFSIQVVPTTTDLMLVSHTQSAAFVFSMAHFLYVGVACVVAIFSGTILLKTQRGATAVISGSAMLLVGLTGVLNSVVVVVRDSARLNSNMDFEWLEPVFRVLIISVVVFFCIALSVPAVAGAVHRQRIAGVLVTLETAAGRSDYEGWAPKRSVHEEDDGFGRDDALRQLNAVVIRLRDQQMIGHGPALTEPESAALAAAEKLLHR